MDWQEKYALIIDEVGMLGARMLYAVNAQLRRLRESTEDFGDIPQGAQDQSDVEFLNSNCYHEERRIPWKSGIAVVTPLNRNRWNLNVEATLAFQRQRHAPLHIFVSEHKWKDGKPTEEEAVMMLGQGDDSAISVPAVFMFVPGMPVVVN
ncbi:hypothetical protein FOPG_18610 [Fusarium oxysporum f. sp. conglutinans race 2 54008]|uniref:Uncharacterized protein n=1 Tax=Fusarium oxysporum f. sp. conglutinans race 2 54008 TaxID=1089457 RepID=X0HVF6_FUSOX|nr:hypothetical protein FOPG_18610 [Fusarium oxysporum f. sp. conglutinans race 2 54008]